MRIQNLTPILNVSNLEESFAWFRRLGWDKRWDYGEPADFGAVGNGDVEIFLCKDGQGGRGAPQPRAPWDDPTGTWMSWWVEAPADVDAMHALAIELGVTVSWPPTDMPWHVRECHIRHPDGHTFRISAGLHHE